MTSEYDVAVIGGGLVGTSIAYGLAKAGQRVALLDEDDRARRASVANFSLIWVQTKGLGMPEYSDWSRGAADRWPAFSDEIKTLTDIDLAFARPGGFPSLPFRCRGAGACFASGGHQRTAGDDAASL